MKKILFMLFFSIFTYSEVGLLNIDTKYFENKDIFNCDIISEEDNLYECDNIFYKERVHIIDGKKEGKAEIFDSILGMDDMSIEYKEGKPYEMYVFSEMFYLKVKLKDLDDIRVYMGIKVDDEYYAIVSSTLKLKSYDNLYFTILDDGIFEDNNNKTFIISTIDKKYLKVYNLNEGKLVEDKESPYLNTREKEIKKYNWKKIKKEIEKIIKDKDLKNSNLIEDMFDDY